jgi:outer membrane immunogenic protein
MKRLCLGIIAFFALAIASPASAADVPRKAAINKAPIVAPAPIFNWSGFYVGLNAGYGWGKSNTASTINDPGAVNFALAVQPFFNENMSARLHPHGFIGGGQIGSNWQIGNAVFGLETDFQYFHLEDSKTAFIAPPPNPGSPLLTHTSVSTDWLFTARARGGLVFDRTLLYVTGGVAATNLNYAQNNFLSDFGAPPPTPPTSSEAVSLSKTKAGWTTGGGLDFMLSNDWWVRAEYLYVDFGEVSGVGFVVGSATPGTPINHHSGHLTANMVRVGINYRFAWGKAPTPVVAKY